MWLHHHGMSDLTCLPITFPTHKPLVSESSSAIFHFCLGGSVSEPVSGQVVGVIASFLTLYPRLGGTAEWSCSVFVLVFVYAMDVRSSIRSRSKLLLLCFLVAILLFFLYTLNSKLHRPVQKVHVVPVDPVKVFSAEERDRFVETVRRKKVVSVEVSGKGSWAKELNLFVTLEDEIIFMKRRGNPYQWQGELYSYYLNAYLGLWNAPPVALLCVNTTHQWKDVVERLPSLGISSTSCFIAVKYVKGLKSAVYVPKRVQQGINAQTVSTTPAELSHSMQWSDMIVLDYISGHSDRLVDSLFLSPLNLEQYVFPVSNVAKTQTGDLVLIDHEATFHTRYSKAQQSNAEHCRQIHFLKKVSVFRRSTVEKICQLCKYDDPASELEKNIQIHDPVSLSIASKLERDDRIELKKRLATVCSITCELLESEYHEPTHIV